MRHVGNMTPCGHSLFSCIDLFEQRAEEQWDLARRDPSLEIRLKSRAAAQVWESAAATLRSRLGATECAKPE